MDDDCLYDCILVYYTQITELAAQLKIKILCEPIKIKCIIILQRFLTKRKRFQRRCHEVF